MIDIRVYYPRNNTIEKYTNIKTNEPTINLDNKINTFINRIKNATYDVINCVNNESVARILNLPPKCKDVLFKDISFIDWVPPIIIRDNFNKTQIKFITKLRSRFRIKYSYIPNILYTV